MNRVQGEQEENEKLIADLTEQLKKLEDEAGEIMKACQEAEVCIVYSRHLLFLTQNWSFVLLSQYISPIP